MGSVKPRRLGVTGSHKAGLRENGGKSGLDWGKGIRLIETDICQTEVGLTRSSGQVEFLKKIGLRISKERPERHTINIIH